MRESIVVAVAVGGVLAVATPAGKVAAMPVAVPDELGLANFGSVERTVLICDPWTCYWRPGYWGSYRPNPYWGLRRHYWWGSSRPWEWRRW